MQVVQWVSQPLSVLYLIPKFPDLLFQVLSPSYVFLHYRLGYLIGTFGAHPCCDSFLQRFHTSVATNEISWLWDFLSKGNSRNSCQLHNYVIEKTWSCLLNHFSSYKVFLIVHSGNLRWYSMPKTIKPIDLMFLHKAEVEVEVTEPLHTFITFNFTRNMSSVFENNTLVIQKSSQSICLLKNILLSTLARGSVWAWELLYSLPKRLKVWIKNGPY